MTATDPLSPPVEHRPMTETPPQGSSLQLESALLGNPAVFARYCDEHDNPDLASALTGFQDAVRSAVRPLSMEDDAAVLQLKSDPTFADSTNKDNQILTGRLLAVETLGSNLHIIGVQRPFNATLDFEGALALWKEHYETPGAHKSRDQDTGAPGGILRDGNGIERFFLPNSWTDEGVRVARIAQSLIGENVRIWKTIEHYKTAKGTDRKKRVAVHIEKHPFQFSPVITNNDDDRRSSPSAVVENSTTASVPTSVPTPAVQQPSVIQPVVQPQPTSQMTDVELVNAVNIWNQTNPDKQPITQESIQDVRVRVLGWAANEPLTPEQNFVLFSTLAQLQT